MLANSIVSLLWYVESKQRCQKKSITVTQSKDYYFNAAWIF